MQRGVCFFKPSVYTGRGGGEGCGHTSSQQAVAIMDLWPHGLRSQGQRLHFIKPLRQVDSVTLKQACLFLLFLWAYELDNDYSKVIPPQWITSVTDITKLILSLYMHCTTQPWTTYNSDCNMLIINCTRRSHISQCFVFIANNRIQKISF